MLRLIENDLSFFDHVFKYVFYNLKRTCVEFESLVTICINVPIAILSIVNFDIHFEFKKKLYLHVIVLYSI